MKTSLSSINNKNGYTLPFVLFLFVLVINMFIFVVLYSLSTNYVIQDKNNYYHVFILEERAKKIIHENISMNQVENYESELIYYDSDYIYFVYEFDSFKNQWIVSLRIHSGGIDEIAKVYYDCETGEMTFKSQ